MFSYSDTLAGLGGELGDAPISAIDMINLLLARRPDYGAGLAADSQLSDGQDQERRPFDDWLAAISALYDPEQRVLLDGRLAIIGLALLEPAIQEMLEKSGFYRALWREIEPPVESMLSTTGWDLITDLTWSGVDVGFGGEPQSIGGDIGDSDSSSESDDKDPVSIGDLGDTPKTAGRDKLSAPGVGDDEVDIDFDELIVGGLPIPQELPEFAGSEPPIPQLEEAGLPPDWPAESESIDAPQSAEVEPLKQARRLEAALPESVRVNETTELLVMLPRSESQGLRAELPIETIAGEIIDREDVTDRDTELRFPAPDVPLVVYMHINVSAHDFEVEDPFRGVLVYPDRDGDFETFYLTPLRTLDRAPLTVRLYEDEGRSKPLSTVRLATRIEPHEHSVEADPQLMRFRSAVAYAAASGPVTINYSYVGGDQISADITHATGVALGGGASVEVSGQPTTSAIHIVRLFTPLLTLVVREAPGDCQVALISDVQLLQEEVERGRAADDNHVANLIQNIVDALPAAIPSIIDLFGQPQTAAAAGTATRFVLSRLESP